MGTILIVEDDEAISDLIKLNLEMVGYKTKQVYDGQKALKIIKDEKFNLILLDVMLPILDGYTIMENINHLDIPVIFLTAKDNLSDRVKGLKMGADDYIVKPFQSIELLARVEAVLRRCTKKEELTFKNINIYLKERVVKKDEADIDLTLKEYELLILLVENRGIALSREKILEKVWGYDYIGETRTVDMHIQKLRKKLDLFEEISTVYKVGYRLET
ncbi:response regulator transcription factor [Inediibacterium massiliense]|uniref:response regulator transcription factor n=1 Tax=Inediibacterium massiliense TaxID=1658111 RepID=UPI0006B45363|nr:response regulator transcription factor [Inediibacterium massiliense]